MPDFHTEQPPLFEQDAQDVRTEVETGEATAESKKGAAVQSLTAAILAERAERLRKQNRKLDLDLGKQEGRYGDVEQIRRDVQRANAVVKATLYAMANRIAEPLSAMEDAAEIRDFLRAELRAAFNDLAFNRGQENNE